MAIHELIGHGESFLEKGGNSHGRRVKEGEREARFAQLCFLSPLIAKDAFPLPFLVISVLRYPLRLDMLQHPSVLPHRLRCPASS